MCLIYFETNEAETKDKYCSRFGRSGKNELVEITREMYLYIFFCVCNLVVNMIEKKYVERFLVLF